MARRELNQTELAAHLGLTTRQIRNLEAEGLPHRAEGNRKWYPIPEAIQWYIEWKRQEVLRDIEKVDFKKPRARKMAAEARMAEIELAKEEGRLLPREVLDETYGRMLDLVRRGLLNMPGRWASHFSPLPPRKAEAIIRRAVAEQLEELSSMSAHLQADAGDLPDDFPGVKRLREAGVESFGDLLRTEDLQEIDGIGPKTEQRILDALEEKGFDAAA